MNQSSLVFDGRLVIDEHNRTNDSLIYAGGSLTKFKRGYYRDDWTHACFNSKEVGNMVRKIEINIRSIYFREIYSFSWQMNCSHNMIRSMFHRKHHPANIL